MQPEGKAKPQGAEGQERDPPAPAGTSQPNEPPPGTGTAQPDERPPRTLGQRLFLLVGSIGPLGHAPASGTVAVAVAGIPLYWVMQHYLGWTAYLCVTAVFTLASMVLHQVGDRILGESDSRRLVWDELVGYLIAMAWIPWDWWYVIAGFFLERFIDIVKVPPANVIDRKMHNGVGVVLDDVVAGVYTCALLHAARYLIGG